MAGGKGTRINLDDEKLLLKYKKPIIFHVVDSLTDSNCFSKISAITSPHSPKTKLVLQKNNVEIFHTDGIGYAEDLSLALQSISDSVLVTSGDLPLLDKQIVQEIVNHYDPANIWTSILVTKKFLTELGSKSNYSVNFNNEVCHYTGISLINAAKINSFKNLDENYIVIDDKRIAFNLNTKEDYELLGTT